jgi:membrane associated rhomboid family serine protease
MRISYNAPVTLTFALVSTLVLVVDLMTGRALTTTLFSVGPSMDPGNPLEYVRLFAHVAGHLNWSHLLSNFAFILLLGPILEEKYGSGAILIMVLLTAAITGLLNILFLSSGLMGASGIVFMMILLVSFANIKQGEIPLTFILVVLLYLAREIVTAMQDDDISQFAHIAGGVCGSLFGFMRPRKS